MHVGSLGARFLGGSGYTLGGQSFPVSGTFTRPADFKSPSGAVGKVLAQCWSGSGGSIGGTGAGGAGTFSGGEVTPGATETVTVATDVASGNEGQGTSFGALVVAERGRVGGVGTGGKAANGTGTTKTDGGDGSTGSGTRGGGGGGGSLTSGTNASGSTPGVPGSPEGGYPSLPGTPVGWPGGGAGSTASGLGGRGGVCCSLYQEPSLANAPVMLGLPTKMRSPANATTHALSAPAVSAGTLLLLIVSADGNPTIDVGTWDDGPGGGALTQINSPGNAGRAFFRVATADANDNVTISTSSSEQVAAHMYPVGGATGAPEWTTTQATNSANANPPAHTNTFGGGNPRATLYLACAGIDQFSGPAISALPSGYGPLVFQNGVEPNGAFLAVTWRQALATSENPGAWGSTSANHWAATIAIPGT